MFDITGHLKRRMKKAKVPNVASEVWRTWNVTLDLNKEHVLFQVERSQEVLKTIFVVTTKKKPSRAQEDNFGTYSTSFWKLCVFFSVKLPNIFRRFVQKSSKQLHTKQNDEDHVLKKIESCFSKYSISQDISKARCKVPKYQT